MNDVKEEDVNQRYIIKYIFNKYVLFILIVFLATGIPATIYFSNLVSNLFIEAFENSSVVIVETDFKNTTNGKPINEPVTGKELKNIESFVDETEKKFDFQEINVWSVDGTLVFSSTSDEPLGQKRKKEGAFAEALKGKTVSEIERRGDPEVKGSREKIDVLEVYVPIHNQAGKLVNIFEIYAPLDPIKNLITTARTIMISFFIVLFVIVVAIGQTGAIVITRRDQSVTEYKMAEKALRQKDRDIRNAYSEVFRAVTNEKLLFLSPEEMSAALGEKRGETYFISSFEQLAKTRDDLRTMIRESELEEDSINKMISASGEAIANGVKHTGECEVQVYSTDGIVQIKVSDEGPGINFRDLPKATLVAGYSTAKSLGMGFSIMLNICDRVLLSTGSKGTTLVLEIGGKRDVETFEDVIDRGQG